MLERLRTPATAAVLAVAYYWISCLVFEYMGGSLPPSWWDGGFVAPRVRVLTWFGMQDVLSAMAAALPVALLFSRLVDRFARRLALAIAAPTALLTFVQAYSQYGGGEWKMTVWISAVMVVLAQLFAVPLLAFVAAKVMPPVAPAR